MLLTNVLHVLKVITSEVVSLAMLALFLTVVDVALL
jgi:hypothetical protein